MPLAGEDRVKLQSLQGFVASELIAFEQEYNRQLSGELELLEEICDHLKQGRSKRFRPTLLLIASKNGDEISEDAIFAAACVEMIHTATLIHDDFIDEAELRRRLPTVNVKWGPSAALIMGDYLYSKVFALLTARRMDEPMRLLARTTHRMSIAEMMQLERKGHVDLAEAEYFTVISEKTASLISSACEIGALLHPTINGEREAFAAFGHSMGLAFQITDDIFDYRGDARRLGKPIGSDWKEGRITLPFISAWRNAPDSETSRLRSYMDEAADNDPQLWGDICDFVQNYGGLEYSYEMACRQGRQAKESLRCVAAHPQAPVLADAVDYVLSRLD